MATIQHATLEAVRADITKETTDAIVNAANTTLLGGGGVDGAIHCAGGPAILAECRKHGGCPTGEARVTTAGRLKAKWIVHTVGPVYRDGRHGEPELLASCYRNSLRAAAEAGARSVSFPAISTGAYGYPIPEAAAIAVGTVAATLPEVPGIGLVRFVAFDPANHAALEAEIERLGDR